MTTEMLIAQKATAPKAARAAGPSRRLSAFDADGAIRRPPGPRQEARSLQDHRAQSQLILERRAVFQQVAATPTSSSSGRRSSMALPASTAGTADDPSAGPAMSGLLRSAEL